MSNRFFWRIDQTLAGTKWDTFTRGRRLVFIAFVGLMLAAILLAALLRVIPENKIEVVKVGEQYGPDSYIWLEDILGAMLFIAIGVGALILGVGWFITGVPKDES